METDAERKEKSRELSALAIAILGALHGAAEPAPEAAVYHSIFGQGHGIKEADALVFALVKAGYVERTELTMLRVTERGVSALGRLTASRSN